MKYLTYKTVGLLITLMTLLVASIVYIPQVEAIEVQEAWGAPTFIYGGGLNSDEVADTKELLNLPETGNYEEFPVSGEDIETYLGLANVSTSAMISSVLVEKEGSGVNVEIETPQNITKVREEQYANAAITAGVEDVTISVASVRPVTGESALTGVYKALEVNGEDLEQERMIIAQKELETTSEIEEDMTEEQSNQFTQVIIQIKQNITNYYEQNNQTASPEEIERIVREALADFNLENVVQGDQINQLIVFFQNYQETSAIDSEAVKEQLNELSSKLGDVWQDVEDSGVLEKIWNAVINFFNEIVNALSEFFA